MSTENRNLLLPCRSCRDGLIVLYTGHGRREVTCSCERGREREAAAAVTGYCNQGCGRPAVNRGATCGRSECQQGSTCDCFHMARPRKGRECPAKDRLGRGCKREVVVTP